MFNIQIEKRTEYFMPKKVSALWFDLFTAFLPGKIWSPGKWTFQWLIVGVKMYKILDNLVLADWDLQVMAKMFRSSRGQRICTIWFTDHSQRVFPLISINVK